MKTESLNVPQTTQFQGGTRYACEDAYFKFLPLLFYTHDLRVIWTDQLFADLAIFRASCKNFPNA